MEGKVDRMLSVLCKILLSEAVGEVSYEHQKMHLSFFNALHSHEFSLGEQDREEEVPAPSSQLLMKRTIN